MSKYKIPVDIWASASTHVGMVECDSIEEYWKKAEELWKSKGYDHPSTNSSNNFDLGDWDICEMEEGDLEYFVNTDAEEGEDV